MLESQYDIETPSIPPPIIDTSHFSNNIDSTTLSNKFEKAPGERFELSDPCEYALYGITFPGARPTRLGDPGIRFANSIPL